MAATGRHLVGEAVVDNGRVQFYDAAERKYIVRYEDGMRISYTQLQLNDVLAHRADPNHDTTHGDRMLGRRVRKTRQHARTKALAGGAVLGTVHAYDPRTRWYEVRFDNGDQAEYIWSELEAMLEPVPQRPPGRHSRTSLAAGIPVHSPAHQPPPATSGRTPADAITSTRNALTAAQALLASSGNLPQHGLAAQGAYLNAYYGGMPQQPFMSNGADGTTAPFMHQVSGHSAPTAPQQQQLWAVDPQQPLQDMQQLQQHLHRIQQHAHQAQHQAHAQLQHQTRLASQQFQQQRQQQQHHEALWQWQQEPAAAAGAARLPGSRAGGRDGRNGGRDGRSGGGRDGREVPQTPAMEAMQAVLRRFEPPPLPPGFERPMEHNTIRGLAADAAYMPTDPRHRQGQPSWLQPYVTAAERPPQPAAAAAAADPAANKAAFDHLLAIMPHMDPYWRPVASSACGEGLQGLVAWGMVAGATSSAQQQQQSMGRVPSTCTLAFRLSGADQAAVRRGAKLQVVCLKVGDPMPYRCHWPARANVTINGIALSPFRGRSGDKPLTANQVDQPLEVTPQVSSTGKATVVITGLTGSSSFALGARLVERVSKAGVRAALLLQKPMDLKAAVAAMRTQEDDELEVSGGVLSLRCPLSAARIATPARFSEVPGQAVFDLDALLDTVERSGKWQCPLSMQLCRPDTVVVDPHMSHILAALAAAKVDVDEVEVKADGWWRPKGWSEDAWVDPLQTDTHCTQWLVAARAAAASNVPSTLPDDDDVDIDAQGAARGAKRQKLANGGAAAGGGSAGGGLVDLTASDDEAGGVTGGRRKAGAATGPAAVARAKAQPAVGSEDAGAHALLRLAGGTAGGAAQGGRQQPLSTTREWLKNRQHAQQQQAKQQAQQQQAKQQAQQQQVERRQAQQQQRQQQQQRPPAHAAPEVIDLLDSDDEGAACVGAAAAANAGAAAGNAADDVQQDIAAMLQILQSQQPVEDTEPLEPEEDLGSDYGDTDGAEEEYDEEEGMTDNHCECSACIRSTNGWSSDSDPCGDEACSPEQWLRQVRGAVDARMRRGGHAPGGRVWPSHPAAQRRGW